MKWLLIAFVLNADGIWVSEVRSVHNTEAQCYSAASELTVRGYACVQASPVQTSKRIGSVT